MKNRTEFQTERGGELGGRAEGEIGVVIQDFADIRRGHFHSAGEFRLRDVELFSRKREIAQFGDGYDVQKLLVGHA